MHKLTAIRLTGDPVIAISYLPIGLVLESVKSQQEPQDSQAYNLIPLPPTAWSTVKKDIFI